MEIAVSRPWVSWGRWWFRNRGHSPLPIFVLALVVSPDFSVGFGPGLILIVLGVALAEWIRVWAVSHAGSSTRTRRDEVRHLVTSGPYRWCRNPLYVANILLYSLFCILFGHLWLTLFAFLYFCLQYSLIVRYEEDLLNHLVGKAYRDYCHSVPRWLVGRRQELPAPAGGRHGWRNAFRSERSTLVALGVVWLFWLIRAYWLQSGIESK